MRKTPVLLLACLVSLSLLAGCARPSDPAPTPGGGGATDPGGMGEVQGVVIPAGEWTWLSGSTLGGQAGVAGEQGVPGADNCPSGRQGHNLWTDSSGALYLFGGTGVAGTEFGGYFAGRLNDLWRYADGEWAWLSGSLSMNPAGSYGSMGVADPSNCPPPRSRALSWIDGSNNLWLYGGVGGTYNAHQGRFADLWRHDGSSWMWVGGSSAYDGTAVFGTKGAAAAGNTPGARSGSACWTDDDGHLWLFGGQVAQVHLRAETWRTPLRSDLWEFDGTDWTWAAGPAEANVPGSYGTLGVAAPGNHPGARTGAVCWRGRNGEVWLFGGSGYDANGASGALNDLWKFDGTSWTWVSGSRLAGQAAAYGTKGLSAPWNCPGSAYSPQVGWADLAGNLWLFTDGELWVFDGQYWTWMGSMPTRDGGMPIPVYGEKGVPAAGNWPGGRDWSAAAVTPEGEFLLFGGYGMDIQEYDGYLNDLWRYRPANLPATGGGGGGEVVQPGSTPAVWTWVGGPAVGNIPGTYGTPGVSSPGNNPGGRHVAASWTDKLGNLWLFGGYGFDGAGNSLYLNDLWKFDGAGWAWITGTGGSPPGTMGVFGVYGEQGVADPANTPGSRSIPAYWADSSGNFWLFGGYGYGSSLYGGFLNDLWKFDGANWTWMAGNRNCRWYSTGKDANGRYVYRWSGSPSANIGGAYGTKGVASPENYPGGRHGATSWTDPSGNLWLFGGKGPMYPGTSERDPGQYVYHNDLWKFDGAEWTWVSGADYTNQRSTFVTQGVPDAANQPGARTMATGWADAAGNLWLYGGYGWAATGARPAGLNDLWRFDGTDWAFVNGSILPGQPAVFSTLGSADPGNTPGAGSFNAGWIDSSGNLWLFGSFGRSDLWRFDGADWALMSGSLDAYLPPEYGAKGAGDLANQPGNRARSAAWQGKDGRFWLFGGLAYQSSSALYLSDLWCYQP